MNSELKMTSNQHIFRCSDELWDKFTKKCSSVNITCTERIRQLILTDVQLEKTNEHIYKLVDDTYHKSGRVPLDLIERNTNPVEYQEVIKYCKDKGYHLTVQTEDVKEWDGKYSLWD